MAATSPCPARLDASSRASQHATPRDSRAPPATRATTDSLGVSNEAPSNIKANVAGAIANARPVAVSATAVTMNSGFGCIVVCLGSCQKTPGRIYFATDATRCVESTLNQRDVTCRSRLWSSVACGCFRYRPFTHCPRRSMSGRGCTPSSLPRSSLCSRRDPSRTPHRSG